MKYILAIASLVFVGYPAQAYVNYSGYAIDSYCRDVISPDKAGNNGRMFCYGYVSAAVDAIENEQQQVVSPPQICLPKEIALGEVAETFARYTGKHPEMFHFKGIALLRNALIEAYPCKPG